MALEEYRRKRDFRKTPEPAGAPSPGPKIAASPSRLSFVIQKHAARRLHYDFRLEFDGVLKSWAVPKGPSLDPGEKRLAVEVEDHPLEYGGFEGVIPEGEYGGGTVMLWDRGNWLPADPDPIAAYRNGMIKFALQGEKLQGDWVLVRIRGRKKADEKQRNWLLIKERDAAAAPGSGNAVVSDHPLSVDSGRSLDKIAADRDRIWHSAKSESAAASSGAQTVATKPRRPTVIPGARNAIMPEQPKPQLANLAPHAPDGDDWLHEIKYDGYRLLARIEHGHVRLITRGGLDWTAKFPELARAFVGLAVDAALIDGEIVSPMPDGTTSFSALQDAIAASASGGLAFFAFDLLHRDGLDLTAARLEDRKAALTEIISPQAQGMLRYSDHQIGQGPAVLRQACRFGLEGIVAKRRDAPYRAGRSASWLKLKCGNRAEFVVVGFTDPAASREGFGALLLGCRERQQGLRYAGRVGTGFNTTQLLTLRRQLDALRRRDAAFALPQSIPLKGVHWIEPRLVAEISFAGWTADGLLRQASFQGLREDKDADEVVCEAVSPTRMSPAMRDTKKADPSPGPAPRARDGSLEFAGIRLSHPDRVLYPDHELTKLDLAHYYAAVADWALPQLGHRPLTLVRTPGGQGKKSFYQKHVGAGMPKAIGGVDIADPENDAPAPVVEDLAGLVALVQMNVLEIHPWGARIDNIETPDRVTFDLDPDTGLPWQRVIEAALGVRAALAGIGFESFVKTTGGKGLHVVAPLAPKLGWDPIKTFTRWVAEQMAEQNPAAFTVNQSLRARHDRIYIDYLRNGRGATAIGAYSPRARPGAPVSTPLFWHEIEQGLRPEKLTVATLPGRLAALGADPWAQIGKLRQSIGAALRRRIGI